MAFADDYGEWKTGVRSSGMTPLNLFFIKLAWASSAGSLVFIAVAYQPGAGNQTPASLQGITAVGRCFLPFSTCCWRSLSAGAEATIP